MGQTQSRPISIKFTPIEISKWQYEKGVKSCPHCNLDFSFFRRKHHCRKCGLVLCNTCSTNYQDKSLRTCPKCFGEISSPLSSLSISVSDDTNNVGRNIASSSSNPLLQSESFNRSSDFDRETVSNDPSNQFDREKVSNDPKNQPKQFDREKVSNDPSNHFDREKVSNDPKNQPKQFDREKVSNDPSNHFDREKVSNDPKNQPKPFDREKVSNDPSNHFDREKVSNDPKNQSKQFDREKVSNDPSNHFDREKVSSDPKNQPKQFDREKVSNDPKNQQFDREKVSNDPRNQFDREKVSNDPKNQPKQFDREKVSTDPRNQFDREKVSNDPNNQPKQSGREENVRRADGREGGRDGRDGRGGEKEDPAVSMQTKVSQLEQENVQLTENLKQIKEIGLIVKDSKLKFQQIKKRDDTINDFAKEEDADDAIKTLQEEKAKLAEIIAENKKRIDALDKEGVVKRKLLSSASDCDDVSAFIEKHHRSLAARLESNSKEIAQMQAELKLALVSATVRGDGYNAQFTGEWKHEIPLSKFVDFGGLLKYRLEPEDDEPFLRYLQPLAARPNVKVLHSEIVHNPAQVRLFHGAIETFENRLASGFFDADISQEKHVERRQQVLDMLVGSPSLATHNRKGVTIVGAFHGTTVAKANSIIKTGFANLATLDDGWYGKGIYFTTHAQYAAHYCKDKENPCLIFCYLILPNPYPVIWEDAPASNKLRFLGKSNYKNFGCHYVPVVNYEGSDFRPPQPGSAPNAQLYDEVVVFQETHVLPYAIVHLNFAK